MVEPQPSKLAMPVRSRSPAPVLGICPHSYRGPSLEHSANAARLAAGLVDRGHTVHYPGLPSHPQHALMSHLMNPGFGYGGVMTLDVGTRDRAARLMVGLQERRVGYLAVSLGYFKTLFSAPGSSTSSEIPVEKRHAMGLSDGLIRFSVGLDSDIARSLEATLECLDELGPEPTDT